MPGAKYAAGTRAWGLCKRCGLRFLLADLVFDGYMPGLRVCVDCYDPKHPQEFLQDVTDPEALWKPSPEDSPGAPVLSAIAVSATILLSWTEPELRGQPRVESYQLFRATSGDNGLTFTAYTLITELPVSYYSDGSLADLVENGNPRFNNEGISAETLVYADTGLAPDVYRYQVIARLSYHVGDSYRDVPSNIVTIALAGVSALDSLSVSGDFVAGAFGVILPPVGTSIESVGVAGDFLAGTLVLVVPCDPDFGNVVLLLHFDGTNGQITTVDSSLYVNTVTVNPSFASLSTSTPKFGTASLGLNGSNMLGSHAVYVPLTLGSALDVFTQPSWTLEGYFNVSNTNSSNLYLVSYGKLDSAGTYLVVFVVDNLDGTWSLAAVEGGASGGIFGGLTAIGAGFAPTLNTWYHWALVNNNGVSQLYLNGVAIGFSTLNWTPANYNNTNVNPVINIGCWPGLSNGTMVGKQDEIRITRGIARYTANFTPPALPFGGVCP